MTDSANSMPPFVTGELAQLGVVVTDEQLSQLARFLDHLLDANTRMNLTGIRERDAGWRRHIVDSLTLMAGLDGIDPGAAVIDIGSGGGLPAIPLAVLLPGVRVTMVEATGKKADYLRSAIEHLGLKNADVLNGRAEKLAHDPRHRESYDMATCRALGPMRELLEYTVPFLAVGGVLLAMKGPTAEQELELAGDAMDILGCGDLAVYDAYPESFNNQSVIVRIVKDRPTPDKYPRLPGVARQSPL
ncbi:MAG: 16S rRNA (guanine(527)-N(7))-methyltransferase RsmG [Phycisphaera sp.]|nr:16S rRNA (guanine(527)-N(7))-methyltransferase RsmG [Phycisphaera sp.]